MQRVILNYFLYPTLQKITIGIDAEMILWTTQMEVRMVSQIIIPVLGEGILMSIRHRHTAHRPSISLDIPCCAM